MIEEKSQIGLPHQIILEGRKNLTVSGVENIESFDENLVVLITSMGELTIHGTDLHITKSNVETGELIMDGTISDFSYSDPVIKKGTGGLFGHFFEP